MMSLGGESKRRFRSVDEGAASLRADGGSRFSHIRQSFGPFGHTKEIVLNLNGHVLMPCPGEVDTSVTFNPSFPDSGEKTRW